jgi:hypothetical protein
MTTPQKEEVAILVGRPVVLFRSTSLDDSYGALALGSLDRRGGTRQVTTLHCERVYFSAGRGLCLDIDRGLITAARAIVFDERFRAVQTIPLNGIPSRARLSPDGRYGATTTFVSGHSYADGSFSTETTLLDLTNGSTLGMLEELAVWRDGSRVQAPDFNFWGVTFARDPDRFYTTLATGGKTYLVVGSVRARSVRIVHENVECPSLSPDETRVAFKRRLPGGGPIRWQPYVLDLASLAETPLAESRSIDDQIEWLDNWHILYALPDASYSAITNVWTLQGDGSGRPDLFIERADSPSVVR